MHLERHFCACEKSFTPAAEGRDHCAMEMAGSRVGPGRAQGRATGDSAPVARPLAVTLPFFAR